MIEKLFLHLSAPGGSPLYTGEPVASNVVSPEPLSTVDVFPVTVIHVGRFHPESLFL